LIINDAPANAPVLSNVGEVGEFRIRNSAKAFNILSSGLYANKIRAIIRELSCNAVDSHTAAGKADTPFDVHLPTSLEPWFSIRDYGTGLNHEQVTNIYTTYFESTKTNSNDFIGALGLGSKSPFSYTDNFTVTAIKDGRKGVYTAFINEAGVPSIALMAEEDSTDPAGVEIKFAVEERYDFEKFRSEARTVYTYFGLRPVVSGPDFEFKNVEYESENIIPGVHSYKDTRTSRAIMGNIAYPIDIPNPESNLGALASLLNCGLEMHFAIGELDFQASREGLSYIPQTIESIKSKLAELNNKLTDVLAQEANAIGNNWDRALFLVKKGDTYLWRPAVSKYVADTKFKLVDANAYVRTKDFKHPVAMMAKEFNISILGFSKSSGSNVCSSLKSHSVSYKKGPTVEYKQAWTIPIGERVFFVINDTKVGALERAKFHWKNGGSPVRKDTNNRYYREDQVLVLSAFDKTKPMKTKEFFASLRNPPTDNVLLASALQDKPRKDSGNSLGANVTIMKLGERGYGGYYREREMVWKDAGKGDQFDSTKTYYYLPLKGFEVISNGTHVGDVKRFYNDIKNAGIGLHNIEIYGVRKTDHAWVAGQKNWVNIQDHLVKAFGNVSVTNLRKLLCKDLDLKKQFRYNSVVAENVPSTSPFVKFVSEFKDFASVDFNRDSFNRLSKGYKGTVDVETLLLSVQGDYAEIKARYPLLNNVRDYDIDYLAIAEYVNLIDAKKGI